MESVQSLSQGEEVLKEFGDTAKHLMYLDRVVGTMLKSTASLLKKLDGSDAEQQLLDRALRKAFGDLREIQDEIKKMDKEFSETLVQKVQNLEGIKQSIQKQAKALKFWGDTVGRIVILPKPFERIYKTEFVFHLKTVPDDFELKIREDINIQEWKQRLDVAGRNPLAFDSAKDTDVDDIDINETNKETIGEDEMLEALLKDPEIDKIIKARGIKTAGSEAFKPKIDLPKQQLRVSDSELKQGKRLSR